MGQKNRRGGSLAEALLGAGLVAAPQAEPAAPAVHPMVASVMAYYAKRLATIGRFDDGEFSLPAVEALLTGLVAQGWSQDQLADKARRLANDASNRVYFANSTPPAPALTRQEKLEAKWAEMAEQTEAHKAARARAISALGGLEALMAEAIEALMAGKEAPFEACHDKWRDDEGALRLAEDRRMSREAWAAALRKVLTGGWHPRVSAPAEWVAWFALVRRGDDWLPKPPWR